MAGPSTSGLPTTVSRTSLPPVFQFHISFTGPYPSIWRRIQVPMDYNFYALHLAIQDAFGWNDVCPYCFPMFSRLPPADSANKPETYEDDTLINVKFQSKGDRSTYTYGRPVVTLLVLLEEIVDRSDEDACYPKCLAGQRGCKPEVLNQTSSMQYTEDFDPESIVFMDPRKRFHHHLLGL